MHAMAEPVPPPGPAALAAWIAVDSAPRRRALSFHTARTPQSIANWIAGDVRPSAYARTMIAALTGDSTLAQLEAWGGRDTDDPEPSAADVDAARAAGMRLAARAAS